MRLSGLALVFLALGHMLIMHVLVQLSGQEVDFAFVTSRWGFSVYGVRDLEAGSWRQRDFGIVYRDDCTRIEVVYKHGETFNRTLGPSESFVVRLTLATLGNTGYGR